MFALAKDPTGKVYSLLNPDGSVNEIAVENAARHAAMAVFDCNERDRQKAPKLYRYVPFSAIMPNARRNTLTRAEHQRWQWQVAHGDYSTSEFVSDFTGASLATDGPMEVGR